MCSIILNEMKNIKYAITGAVALLMAACILNSCNEDEGDHLITGDTENRVYVNTETSYINNYKFTIVHTPVSSEGTITASFPVRCTKEASTEVKVTVGLDNSLVDQYNNSKASLYSKLQESQVTLTNPVLTIPAGAMISVDSVKVTVPAEQLTYLRDQGYLLPVKIKSVTGNSVISSNLNSVLFFITTSWTNCYNSQSVSNMTGIIVTPRTGWTASIDVPLYSGNLGQLFDGSTNSYWQIRPSGKFILDINMASEYQSITGLRWSTNSTSYGLSQVKVYTSLDGTDWTYQGTPTLLTSSAYQYVRFYAPVNARFIRIEAVSWRSTSRIYMAEFDIYM